MKQHKQTEWAVRIGLLIFLAAAAYKCHTQEMRFNTSPGLVIASKTNDPDEICLKFGNVFQSVKAEHLQHSGRTLEKRLACALMMADDAGVNYRTFLMENSMPDNKIARAYYAKCKELRLQFLEILPERAFLELRHITQYFNQ